MFLTLFMTQITIPAIHYSIDKVIIKSSDFNFSDVAQFYTCFICCLHLQFSNFNRIKNVSDFETFLLGHFPSYLQLLVLFVPCEYLQDPSVIVTGLGASVTQLLSGQEWRPDLKYVVHPFERHFLNSGRLFTTQNLPQRIRDFLLRTTGPPVISVKYGGVCPAAVRT